MQEEFHGISNSEGITTALKQLYGWGTINVNVWLPSLSELVGIHTNQYYEPHGCYSSAMQGLNLSGNPWTDAQGGTQFAYLQQFNANGGGEKIWDTCNQQAIWLRSSVFAYADRASVFYSAGVSHQAATVSHAVHPAAEDVKNNFILSET